MVGVLAVASSASAQGVGVKGGLVFADFSSDAVKYENRTGWQGGLFVGGNLPGVLGAQVEFNYLEKKTRGLLGQEIKLDYLQIPLLLKLHTPAKTASSFQAYGIVGPSVDIKVGDSIGGIDVKDSFNGLDLGLMFGGGIEAGHLIFEGRYSRGLRKVNKAFDDLTTIKSHSFAVLAGIRFR
jgi:hypothetical protein